MNELLTAAFLIMIGSQEPCPTMGLGDGIMGDSGFYPTPPVKHVPLRVLPAKDRPALDAALGQWLGDLCNGPDTFDVKVLDVKAGKWLTFKQTRETKPVVRTERERTGRIITEPKP